MIWAIACLARSILAATAKSLPANVSAPFGESLVVVAGRSQARVDFERQVVDFFVGAADLLGVPKSVAAIYGVVFASPAALSFSEIKARLDISAGSISQGLRVLREVGALKEVSSDSDRAELFEPDMELRELVSRFLESRLQKQLEAGVTRLDAIAKGIPTGGNGESAELRRRLKSLSNWHRRAKTLLPLVRSVLKVSS